MIIGHKKNLEFLTSALDSEKIAHALCFVGPDEIGKRRVAEEIASRALNVDKAQLNTHPDYLFIEREVDEKKGRLNRDINIAQAKRISGFLRNHSWIGKMKIVVINDAESLNSEAANALLKTLEESSEGNIIILLTTNDQSFPATVRSRCQIVAFSLVPEEEILSGLVAMGYEQELGGEATALSWGRPGRAIKFLRDQTLLNEYKNEIERLKNISGQPFYLKLKQTEDLFGDKDDAIRGRDRLKKVLDLWIMVWRDVLKGAGFFGKTVSSKEALGVIDELQLARQMLGQNIHPRLLIERILLKI